MPPALAPPNAAADSQALGPSNTVVNALAMLVLGALPNGPYCLISNSVAVDLGLSVKGNRTLLATVIAIIDATGSLGAALQGVAVAWVTAALGWDAVFYMFIVCCGLSALLLARLVRNEWMGKRVQRGYALVDGQPGHVA